MSIDIATKPILIIIRGLPGSGKSHLAHAVERRIGSDKVVILDPDATDYKSDEYKAFSENLTKEGVDAVLHPYRFLRARGYKGIVDDKIVIWNQAFTNNDILNRTIKNLQAYAEERGKSLPALVVEMQIPHDTAKERIASREAETGRGVPNENFERFIRDYTTFEGYDTHTVITAQGDSDTDASVDAVITALNKL